MKDLFGETALMNLFASEKVNNIDFDSKWFKKLIEYEKDSYSNKGHTPLMVLINHNVQLLTYIIWFIPILFESAGIKDENGLTALDIYLKNNGDADSPGFKKL